jgi:hypothetical protein
MAQNKRPGIKVLFCTLPTWAEVAAGVGEFLPAPINVPDVVEAVGRLLQADG